MARGALGAAFAAAVLVVPAAGAHASTVQFSPASGNVPAFFLFSDIPGDSSEMFVWNQVPPTAGGVQFRDGPNPIFGPGKVITIDSSAAPFCTHPSTIGDLSYVDCTKQGAIVVVSGGDGNDIIKVQDAPVAFTLLRGGDGDDTISGGPGEDLVEGGNGNDEISGGPNADLLQGDAGNDALVGGAGDDELEGGEGNDILGGNKVRGVFDEDHPGADIMSGGAGFDVVAYGQRFGGFGVVGPVTVTFDGIANDGRAGEQDSVGDDVEEIEGANEGDRLVADDQPRALHGNHGPDTITGGPGADGITGGNGVDTIDGAGGDDTIDGNGEGDRITGGPGRDTLAGDGGCLLGFGNCTDGNDEFSLRDGEVDTVNCHGGADIVTGDTVDVLDANCEKRDLVGPPQPQPTPQPPPPPPAVSTLRAPARVGPAGVRNGINITVTGPVNASVKATLLTPAALARRLGLRKPAVATATGRIRAANGSLRLTLRLPRATQRRSAAFRRATLTVRVVITGPGGTVTLTRRIRVT